MIITKDDQPQIQMENLRKAMDFSLKVSQCDSFELVESRIKSVLLEDTLLWISVFNCYSKM